MAQYYENFGAQTPGIAPAGWTQRWVTAGSPLWVVAVDAHAVGGQFLRQSAGSGSSRLLSRDDVDADVDRADAEVLVRFSITVVGVTTAVCAVRASGTGTVSTQNGYRTFVSAANGLQTLVLNRIVSGSSVAIGTLSIPPNFIQAGRSYWARLRADGTTISTKLWLSGETEPVSWMISVTDSGVSAAGSVGVCVFNNTGVQDFDVVSIATDGETAAFADPIPSSDSVQFSQLDISTVTEGTAALLDVSQYGIDAIFNIPSAQIDASQFDISYLGESPSVPVDVSQFDIDVVYRGLVASPQLRTWTFPLDSHRFYGIDLGRMEKTLVYDMHSQQWAIWGSGSSDWWRVRTLRNWLGGRGLAPTRTSIIAGDGTTGMLYWLSPDFDNDSGSTAATADTPVPFERTVTGQIVVKPGYASAPCFGVQIEGSIGSVNADLTVNLSISDDRGNSYWSAGDITLTGGEWNARLNWRSLGSMRQPGRLFRVTDTGALKRIDSAWAEDPR